MSDPRFIISLAEVGAEYATFLLHSGIVVTDIGKAMTITGDKEVGVGSDGGFLFGKLVAFGKDGVGTIQYEEFIEFDYDTNAAPAVGGKVVVNGAGKVRKATDITGQTAAISGDAQAGGVAVTVSGSIDSNNRVVSVDTTAHTCVVKVS